jgi:predicted Fe-Mo cluster-binding NifX family protein
MKIAITSTSGESDAGFDPHFGRASHFCIVDLDREVIDFISNPAVIASSGAGIRAAQLMGGHGVSVVISGSFGPKAFQALRASGIAMYVVQNGDSLAVSDVLAKFKAGQLQPLKAPSHDGSYGRGEH